MGETNSLKVDGNNPIAKTFKVYKQHLFPEKAGGVGLKAQTGEGREGGQARVNRNMSGLGNLEGLSICRLLSSLRRGEVIIY